MKNYHLSFAAVGVFVISLFAVDTDLWGILMVLGFLFLSASILMTVD